MDKPENITPADLGQALSNVIQVHVEDGVLNDADAVAMTSMLATEMAFRLSLKTHPTMSNLDRVKEMLEEVTNWVLGVAPSMVLSDEAELDDHNSRFTAVLQVISPVGFDEMPTRTEIPEQSALN